MTYRELRDKINTLKEDQLDASIVIALVALPEFADTAILGEDDIGERGAPLNLVTESIVWK